MLTSKKPIIIILNLLFYAFAFASVREIPPRSAGEILRSYVEDFRNDPAAAESMTFGVRIKDGDREEWCVEVGGGKKEAGSYRIELHRGLPPSPSVIYTLDLATLCKIDSGEINALTAMGRARASDPAPMDIEFMEGFEPGPDFLARFLAFTFHFWTRGFPETVEFGKRHSRKVHGGNMVVFYYREGLRTAWAQIEKGQHVNKDPKDQSNPFPTMMIGIRGKAIAKIGGKEVVMEGGQMVFIPAGISHEAWNPYDEPAEIILLMFGEGA
jgi:mannose-6-phosphate isomerase-like protein (cupin superfamily)